MSAGVSSPSLARREPPKIRPYRVVDVDRTVDDVFAWVNDQNYWGYSTNHAWGGCDKLVAGTPYDYEALIAAIAEVPHVDFVKHVDMLSEPCPPDRIRVGIRHDVDTDIVAALQQAEIEHRYGAATNWCVLHTAPYYGRFAHGIFERHRAMAHVYRALQDYGHEVSLHSDPLHIYQDHKIDGAEAVVTEIAWLRAQGLDIRGSTAHNFRPTYGAENYEIFRGYSGPSGGAAAQPDHVWHDGKWAPLRVLDPEALGLRYEGNEIKWQRHTPVEYFAPLSDNFWASMSCWVPESRRVLDQPRAIERIRSLEPGRCVVIVVHPCYYGGRDRPTSSPLRRRNDVTTVTRAPMGWPTYDPERVQCWSGPRDRPQRFQTIQHPNAFGMLDKPWPETPPADDTLRVLLLGSDHLDGLPVHVTSHVGSVLARRLGEGAPVWSRFPGSRRSIDGDAKACVRTLAFPGMGIGRLWAWYTSLRAELRPDVVVLGVGDQSVRENVPAAWSRATGFSLQHPPAPYLHWSAEAGVREVDASPAWRAHRRDGFRLDTLPNHGPLDGALAEPGGPGQELLHALYGHVVNAIRADGARPVLLLEGLGERAGWFHEHAGDPGVAADRAGTRERLEALAAALDVPLIDPYIDFEAVADHLPAHAPTDHRWNVTAHRLAAEALERAFVELGIVT